MEIDTGMTGYDGDINTGLTDYGGDNIGMTGYGKDIIQIYGLWWRYNADMKDDKLWYNGIQDDML